MISLNLAKPLAKESCNAANEVARRAAQTPLEITKIANELVTTGIQHALGGIEEGIEMIATIVEQLILFTIELTLGTYACLTVSLVDIVASEALNATKSVVHVANSTVQTSVTALSDGLGALSSLINGAVGLIDDVTELIDGGDSDIKKVNLTIDGLRNFSISSDIDTEIDKLQSDIPTYNETKASMESFIKKPFDYIRQEISSSNITFKAPTINTTVYNTENLNSCNLTDFEGQIDKVKHAIDTFFIIAVVILALSILLAIFWSAWATRSHWERLEEATQDTGIVQKPMVAQNSINFVEAPWIQRKLLKVMRGKPVIWEWYVNYICHVPAMTCLGIAVAGAIITILEFIGLKIFSRGAIGLGHELNKVENSLKHEISDALVEWRNSTNKEIESLENQINDEILGWVRNGSGTVNSSLAHFMSTINKEIDSVFGGTVFEKPIKAVAQCVIGDKVDRVEKGMTWIHSKAQVNMSRIPSSVFNGIQNSSTTSALNSNMVNSVLQSAESTIRFELVMQGAASAAFFGLWLSLGLGALVYVHWFAKKLPENSNPFDDSKTITEKPPLSTRISRFLPGPARRPVVNYI